MENNASANSSNGQNDFHEQKRESFETREAIKKNKHLIFKLHEERFGIPLLLVKEVIALTSITAIPHVPEFFKGLINLRGKIISVIDMRSKFILPITVYDPRKTCIIISEVKDFTLGMVVDDVLEVAGFESHQIENNINIDSETGNQCIVGVAKTTDKKLTLLVDLEKALDIDVLKKLREKIDSSGMNRMNVL
ncbi:MAG: purine-binding chemotaxis protein CheW [Oligoflexia bacterium]|nr:purine-binding chemotaxis protein CheW [Oligoflexia bacterium]MBF0366768.1 purine-binding chemotaxis protein CheW [Oligoflexia bacterium]